MRETATANWAAAVALIDELARAGVRHAVVSPGQRSAPLALAVATAPGLRDHVVIDERAAGFFALGMARQLGAPVALVCTSGTAAANYLPAVVEASLSEVPLVVLTADRPPELRRFGATQTIDQVGLYGPHARWHADAAVPTPGLPLDAYFRALAARAVATATAAPAGPVHLNLPMREPLVPATPPAPARDDGRPPIRVVDPRPAVDPHALAEVAATLGSEPCGLVVCGPRAGLAAAAAALATLADRLGWPILADPLSGARFAGDAHAQADGYDVLLRDPGFAAAHRPRALLQLGALPVSKTLERFLAGCRPAHHVVVASPGTWPDPLHGATAVVHASPATVVATLAALVPPAPPHDWRHAWVRASERVRAALVACLAEEPTLVDGLVAAALVQALPDGAVLHVGNSMPVRDLDTFVGARPPRHVRIDGNRGASGIDGVVATALGAATVADRPVALLVGDVSVLHDLGALEIAARHRTSLTVVLVHNDGGGIFGFLPQAAWAVPPWQAAVERAFATPHGLSFAGAVTMAGGRLHRVVAPRELAPAIARGLASPGLDVIEVHTTRATTVAHHRAHVDAALAALHAAEAAEACR